MKKTLAANFEAEQERIKAEEKAKEEEKLRLEQEEQEQEAQRVQTRSMATSRSGSHEARTSQPVYYEALALEISAEEVEILERIVQAEAGGSGYDGMLAVANVVLNRVQSERFPNTVTEVVFANRQFTPISDGRYYTVTVSDSCKQVVQDVLSGARIIGQDALYFCTPTASGKGWFETALRKIDYIAPHNFYGYKEE
ncbi:MAG: cell wall hydrolase [Clostridia bacterium]|nr:cell wall hydrolase [Clostridia bacterium]